jgi:hypothetical protein
MVCWLIGCKYSSVPCNVSSQQSNFKKDMNTYHKLKLTIVRSVAISAIFVRNDVVQTMLPIHAVRTCGNVF